MYVGPKRPLTKKGIFKIEEMRDSGTIFYLYIQTFVNVNKERRRERKKKNWFADMSSRAFFLSFRFHFLSIL